MVAAAQAYPLPRNKGIQPVQQHTQGWQSEAWRHFDICGELRYSASYVSNVLSRAILYVAKMTPDGPVKVDTGPPVDALHALFATGTGMEEMLKQFGLHLTVPGEGFLIGHEVSGEDVWEVLGTKDVRQQGDIWAIRTVNGQFEDLPDSAVVIRFYQPHPADRFKADSPVRAVLPILSEIEYLTRHIFAQVQSRLAGAGILEIPQGMTFPVVPGTEGLGTADQFMRSLGTTMIKPISDPGDPAAIVPIVVASPDDLIGKMNKIEFWSPLDQHAVELRTEAIRRLALGMETPPEVMLGTGDTNHWSAWLVEESTIKAHIEPLLAVITRGLTTQYLRPVLEDTNNEFLVMADTAQMRLRPNRSKEAIELYDRGELDGEALRRETGFTEDDSPDVDQLKEWLLKKVAGGSATPEQVGAALKALGVDLGDLNLDGTTPREARPDPSLVDHPRRNPPEVPSVAEALVFRALERAGNKIRSMYGVRPPGVNAVETYRFVPVRNGDLDKVMEDAWGSLPVLLGRWDCDVETIQRALDSYTRSLLTTQAPHEFDKMCGFLQAAARV